MSDFLSLTQLSLKEKDLCESPSLVLDPIHPSKRPLPPLPLDLWYEILALLDIKDAIAVSKAHPRFFGAFLEDKQTIRFRNALNSYVRSSAVDLDVCSISSFVCLLSRGTSMEFSSLISWLTRRFKSTLSSNIVFNSKLFANLSSTIVLKDRGFVSVSSRVTDWNVEMKAEDNKRGGSLPAKSKI
jgi:hypothetical protein